MKKMFALIMTLVFTLLSTSSAFSSDRLKNYDDVIDLYRFAMTNHLENDRDALEGNGIPIEFGYGGQTPQPIASMIDIDQDGSPELIIYNEDRYMLWNAYTMKDGDLIRLFVGAGRDRWYLTRTDDGEYLFENEGSSGASNSVNFYYKLKKGELIFMYGVIYDAESQTKMNSEYILTGDERKKIAHSAFFTTKTDQRGRLEYVDLTPISEMRAKILQTLYEKNRFFPEGNRIVP